jgi:hypothetical protein
MTDYELIKCLFHFQHLRFVLFCCTKKDKKGKILTFVKSINHKFSLTLLNLIE